MEGEMKTKYYKSISTGNEYAYNEYCNWGRGKTERGMKDLPKDEYPYKIITK